MIDTDRRLYDMASVDEIFQHFAASTMSDFPDDDERREGAKILFFAGAFGMFAWMMSQMKHPEQGAMAIGLKFKRIEKEMTVFSALLASQFGSRQ
jgi:hypothetical protein